MVGLPDCLIVGLGCNSRYYMLELLNQAVPAIKPFNHQAIEQFTPNHQTITFLAIIISRGEFFIS